MRFIDNRLERPLPPYIEKVLEAMFVTYKQVIVKSEFSDGYGGSRVFLVRPIRQDGQPELPSVVKIDDFDRIEQEWQSYQNCIHNRLPSVARISSEPIYPPDSQLGGLRYPLAGDAAFDVLSLYDYCQKASLEDITYVLKERLFKSLDKLWQQKKFQPDLHFHTAYDSFLYPNLLLKYTSIPIEATLSQLRPDTVQRSTEPYQVGDVIQLSGFQVVRVLRKSQSIVLDIPTHLPSAYRLLVQSVPNVASYEVGQIIHQPLVLQVKQTRAKALQEQAAQVLGSNVDLTADSLPLADDNMLPNPLTALPQLLNQSLDVFTACIHGDLHMRNVLVEPKSGNVHLIDFVNARQAHVLRDLLNLEIAVVTRLVPMILDKEGYSSKRIISFYRRLHCALRHPGQVLPPPELEKPFVMLQLIRGKAEHYLCQRGEWREYYYGLIFYLLGSLRYDDLNNISGAKQIAFWGASTILQLSKAEPPCHEFLIGHDTQESDTPSGSQQKEMRESGRLTKALRDNRSGGVYFGSNLFTRPRILVTISVAILTIIFVVWIQNELTPPSLYIISQRDNSDTYLIKGDDIESYSVSNTLVVYGETIPDVEEPIALLRITAKNPDTLSAQTILVHPNFMIRPSFRVDNKVEELKTSELVPANDIFIGYFLSEEHVRVRPGGDIKVNDTLQTYIPQSVDEQIIDYLPSDPPIKMRVLAVGPENAIAQVELVSGDWPEIGALLKNVPLSDVIQRPAQTVPTQTLTPTDGLGPCQLESIQAQPPSPQPIGTLIVIRIRGVCDSSVRAIRLFINDEWYGEQGGNLAPPEGFVLTWRTDNLSAGEYELRAEVATWNDNDGEISASQVITYTLTTESSESGSESAASIYRQEGLSAIFNRDYEKAIDSYTQAIELDPGVLDDYIKRGVAYMNTNRTEQALADFTEAITLDANNADAYNLRGSVNINIGEYEQAVADFTQAIALNPNNALFYNNRGIAYMVLSQFNQAIADFEKILEISDDQDLRQRAEKSLRELGVYPDN